MKSFFKKYIHGAIFSSVIVLCVFLIGAAVILLDEYSKGLEEQAKSRVESYAIDTTYLLDGRLDEINRKVHHFLFKKFTVFKKAKRILSKHLRR